jgi:hypothetical protein
MRDSINDADEMSEEQKRLCLVWGCVYYATGEVTADGNAVCRLGAPPTERAWWGAFQSHIAKLWYDTDHEWLAMHGGAKHGPNAYDPQLAPLKENAKERGAFDLSDPLTYLVWLDFIGRYPERGQAWEEFQREHGAIEILTPERD